MKIWIDNIRPAPEEFIWCKNVNEAIDVIKCIEKRKRFVCLDGTIFSLPVGKTIELVNISGDTYDILRILEFLDDKPWRRYVCVSTH
jgi:hypothetical protein